MIASIHHLQDKLSITLDSSSRDLLHVQGQHLASYLRDQKPWDQLLKSPLEKQEYTEHRAQVTSGSKTHYVPKLLTKDAAQRGKDTLQQSLC